jgi:hypothetical protein
MLDNPLSFSIEESETEIGFDTTEIGHKINATL